jgi:hypothetical protein
MTNDKLWGRACGEFRNSRRINGSTGYGRIAVILRTEMMYYRLANYCLRTGGAYQLSARLPA